MSLLLNLIELIVGLGILGIIVIVVYAHLKGTGNSVIMTKDRTELKLEEVTATEAKFSTEFSMVNIGSEDCTILDVFARPYLPQEQYDKATVSCHVETTDRRRSDNYFEAMLLPQGTERRLILTLTFVANGTRSIKEALNDMVDMDVAVYHDGASRKLLYTKRAYTTFFSKEFKDLVGGKENE